MQHTCILLFSITNFWAGIFFRICIFTCHIFQLISEKHYVLYLPPMWNNDVYNARKKTAIIQFVSASIFSGYFLSSEEYFLRQCMHARTQCHTLTIIRSFSHQPHFDSPWTKRGESFCCLFIYCLQSRPFLLTLCTRISLSLSRYRYR